MTRAILIAPVSLLSQAEQFIAKAFGGDPGAYGFQRWQDPSGAQFAVAAGVFSEEACQMASSSETPITILRFGVLSVAPVSGITLAITNTPLATLDRLGLIPLNPSGGQDLEDASPNPFPTTSTH